MKPFEPSEEATDTKPSSERLQAFTKAVWDALVPSNGECASVQGELVRANERLWSECLQNGMGNYYDEGGIGDSYYGKLALLILDTLGENRGGALSEEDVAYFADVRRRLEPDWALNLRIRALEQKEEELTQAEMQELEELEGRNADRIDWERFCGRAERCIANWCISNPELVDRRGRPVEERGVRNLEHVFAPPPPPPKCPLCQGRGFIQKDEKSFPEICSCQGGSRARRSGPN